MNKDGILLDDKIIIEDEEKNLTTRVYYEGLEEVLVQENIIETIEKEIPNLEEKIDSCKIDAEWKRKRSKEMFLVGLMVSPILALLFLGFDFSIDAFSFPFSFMSGVRIISKYMLGSLVFSSVFFGTFSLLMYSGSKDEIKMARGFESKLSILRKKLPEEKKKLEELQLSKEKSVSDHSCINSNPIRIKIEDKQVLKQLRDELSFYEYCGYYENKFVKDYQKGILDEKLRKNYSEDEIAQIHDYLEERGYQKSLKYDNHN